jgi:hypothetical protein
MEEDMMYKAEPDSTITYKEILKIVGRQFISETPLIIGVIFISWFINGDCK